MTLTDNHTETDAPTAPRRRTGRWIDDWRPEERGVLGDDRAAAIARRNLIWSIFAEHLGFSVWLIWSVSSAFLLSHGLRVHARSSCSSWSRSPTWSAALLRVPYTLAVGRSSAAATGRWSAPPCC